MANAWQLTDGTIEIAGDDGDVVHVHTPESALVIAHALLRIVEQAVPVPPLYPCPHGHNKPICPLRNLTGCECEEAIGKAARYAQGR